MGPIHVPAGTDIISVLRAMGLDVRIDPMDKPIPIGIVKVEPMKQPVGGILFMKFEYGRTKGRILGGRSF